MIIRTSGETRLSDFLLWQASSSFICFTEVLWPDLSYSRFAWLIIKYQISHKRLQEDRAELEKKQLEWQTECDIEFLQSLYRDKEIDRDDLEKFRSERMERISTFLKIRRQSFEEYIDNLAAMSLDALPQAG
jgi:ditrans,polycis-polyprenyl diphosphate synthase